MAVGVGIALFAFVFAYLAVNIDKRHGPLQIFFIILSMFFMGADALVLSTIANEAGSTNVESLIDSTILNPLIWIIIVVIAYFLIYFIYNVLMDMADKKERGWTIEGE